MVSAFLEDLLSQISAVTARRFKLSKESDRLSHQKPSSILIGVPAALIALVAPDVHRARFDSLWDR